MRTETASVFLPPAKTQCLAPAQGKYVLRNYSNEWNSLLKSLSSQTTLLVFILISRGQQRVI
jgi:hypothetical protein